MNVKREADLLVGGREEFLLTGMTPSGPPIGESGQLSVEMVLRKHVASLHAQKATGRGGLLVTSWKEL